MMRKQQGFTVIQFIGLSLVLGVLSAGLDMEEQNCYDLWTKTKKPVEYTVLKGCMIQQSDGTWLNGSTVK